MSAHAGLSKLLGLVTDSLLQDLESAAEIEDPAMRAATVEKARAQAITFLKNNGVVATAETDPALEELAKNLAERRNRQRGKRTDTEVAADVEAFAAVFAGGPSLQ